MNASARRASRILTAAVVMGVVVTATPFGSRHPTRLRAQGVPAAPAAAPRGLAAVFAPGSILQDRNGDDLVDFVAARIVIPDVPAVEEVAAAAAIAARLGLETSGLTLPLVVRAADDEPDGTGPAHIYVGAGHDTLPAATLARLAELPPDTGAVLTLGQAVAVIGNTPAGTQAAAEAFAGRSPYLWSIIGREHGDTYDRISRDTETYLSEGGVGVEAVSVDELVYQRGRREASSISLSVTVDAGSTAAALERLRDLEQRHARGEATDRLSYASVARLDIDVVSDRGRERFSLPRVGIPQALLNPPRREPTRFQTRTPSAPGREPSAGRRFDLAQLLETGGGLLRDEDRDRIPDDVDAMVVLPQRVENGLAAVGVSHLGARLGLESTGLGFPLFGFDSELEDPDTEQRPLVLVGRDNAHTGALEQLGKLRGDPLQAGVGRIELVPDGWNGNSAVVVTGGDLRGEEAATDYLARRLPYVWDTAKGQPRLSDARAVVRRTLEGRTTASQAALALTALDEILDDLNELSVPPTDLRVDAYFEEASDEFDRWLADTLRTRLPEAEVEVETRSRLAPVEVFTQQPELGWEVDRFRERFRDAVLPRIDAGTHVAIELRVSESPELRQQLVTEIREAIEARGGTADQIRVLSAYKQGLSWLMDTVVPALRGRAVEGVEIGWEPVEVDTSQEWRFYNEPTRWLNELYPVDELIARELGIPIDAVRFVARPESDAIYSVAATDRAGAVLLADDFSPRFYERPHLDAFPDAAEVMVTTGWLEATVDGVAIVDERIATDLDAIWDHYQGTTLPAVYDHIKSVTGGAPTADTAPYFHTLRVELQASEPDYLLDLDQEHVSSLESLHDSFYFDTLDFFYEAADAAGGDDEVPARSLAAGNVLPWIHPERRGAAPSLEIAYSGFASKQPKIVVTYHDAAGEEQVETRTFEPTDVPEPYVYLADVRAGGDRLERLGFLVTLGDTDNGEALPRLTDLLENLTRLQTDGLFPTAFDVPSLGQVLVRVEAPGATRTRRYPAASSETPPPPVTPHPGTRLVTWDHVISPDESERIAHTLGTTDHVTTYVAGTSYQGRPVSVMEITLPMEAELVSQAKMSSWKPVLSIVGRQHANEVSSTSHILRLAELLATDPEYTRYLDRMNIVIQPVVNPDGAALAYELQQLTPTHCLHAGRYSALGPDVPGQAGNPDTLLTEALVLSQVTNTWLPDVRLNPHGYPSHEWVQHFANYNPKSFRSYWIPRGWYTSVQVPEHPGLADAREVSLAMRDRIADEVSRDPDSLETNTRIYDRYERWAIRWQPHVYRLEIHDDTAIYSSRRGGTVRRPGTTPVTTIFSGGTEAMDETAQGPWLDLVTRMGFGYLMASVKFLDEAEYSLFRLEEERGGRTRFVVSRPRPVRPGGASR